MSNHTKQIVARYRAFTPAGPVDCIARGDSLDEAQQSAYALLLERQAAGEIDTTKHIVEFTVQS